LGPQEVVMKGLAELQSKLANLIYGLKNQPDLELMANEQPQNGAGVETGGGWGMPPAPAPAPPTAAPASTWSGGASSQWGSSSPGQRGATNATGSWGGSPNAGSWSSGAAAGWGSPGQQANGWNV